MSQVTELDALTGETVVRDFTSDELSQREADAIEAAAQRAAIEVTETNRATIESRAVTALQGNRDFLALATPTNAQTLAQVKALTRQNTAVIRLLLGLLDDTE